MDAPAPPAPSPARQRLWQAFLGGRLLVASVLLALQGLQAWGLPGPVRIVPAAWLISSVYMLACGLSWLLLRRRPLPARLHPAWLLVLGVDMGCIFGLQLLQTHSMHYTPLLALPILMAATLGSLVLALGTTAAVTLLLLGGSAWNAWLDGGAHAESYVQTALTCAAYFVLAYLSHQLAQRLSREEQRALRHQQQALAHVRVNALIIEQLPEGVLVLDAQQQVQHANPTARRLLTNEQAFTSLQAEAAWAPLRLLVEQSFALQQGHSAEVSLLLPGQSPLHLYVRTWLTDADLNAQSDAGPPARLCLMFLEDLREAQARLRTEKLAAMGRMSAAVAHEIRNPLAAIMQANALLTEELEQPAQQRLAGMVQQNAERLARIAEEILDIARVQNQRPHATAAALRLDGQTAGIWREWCQQAPEQRSGKLALGGQDAAVEFEAEHLRRVVVNLLDNALRFISAQPEALQLITGQQPGQPAWLQVWSDGAPLDASVQRHLFEPFFSSHSRSSGLGLYLCRELCQRYGADLHYQRVRRPMAGGLVEGNAFTIVFRHASQPTASSSLFDTNMV